MDHLLPIFFSMYSLTQFCEMNQLLTQLNKQVWPELAKVRISKKRKN